jgi:hypothetical protein
MMSALHLKADIRGLSWNVRQGLEADIGSSSNPNIVFGGAVAALIASIEHSSRFDEQ